MNPQFWPKYGLLSQVTKCQYEASLKLTRSFIMETTWTLSIYTFHVLNMVTLSIEVGCIRYEEQRPKMIQRSSRKPEKVETLANPPPLAIGAHSFPIFELIKLHFFKSFASSVPWSSPELLGSIGQLGTNFRWTVLQLNICTNIRKDVQLYGCAREGGWQLISCGPLMASSCFLASKGGERSKAAGKVKDDWKMKTANSWPFH